jgi:hypothetical protein
VEFTVSYDKGNNISPCLPTAIISLSKLHGINVASGPEFNGNLFYQIVDWNDNTADESLEESLRMKSRY